MLEAQENLAIFQQSVVDIEIRNGRVEGVLTAMGLKFSAPARRVDDRDVSWRPHPRGGSRAMRAGVPAILPRMPWPSVCAQCRSWWTGSRPGRRRASREDTVDFSRMQPQWGDEPSPVMSFISDGSEHPRQGGLSHRGH